MAEVISTLESPVGAGGNTEAPIAAPSPPLPFTPAEEGAFQQADRQAAAMVAGLMLAIFTIALLGYSLICFFAARGGS